VVAERLAGGPEDDGDDAEHGARTVLVHAAERPNRLAAWRCPRQHSAFGVGRVREARPAEGALSWTLLPHDDPGLGHRYGEGGRHEHRHHNDSTHSG
jgi:hypothetical protein